MPLVTPLQNIDPDLIRPNPENPRLIFHEDEMNELLNSINEVGIKVPLSVYEDGEKYVLLDGERRWRCSKKLNLKSVPAIIQPKPTRLENLLMMFNIHNVRVDWDLMPMAFKLKDIRDLLEKDGKDTSHQNISGITGVRLSTVKRAFELLEMPKVYQNILMKEAEKPRSEQKIKVDLFVEIFKSFNAIRRHIPEVLKKVSKDEYVRSMVNKYRNRVVDNVVSYREITKIARAEVAGIDKKTAVPIILRLIRDKNYKIADAYEDSVKNAFEQRDLVGKMNSITEKLSKYKNGHSLKPDLLEAMKVLGREIYRLMKN